MKLTVEGMTCGHCVRTIERAVSPLGGIAQVHLESKTVFVDGPADPEAVRQAIENEGYTVVAMDAAEPATAAPAASTCCGSCHA